MTPARLHVLTALRSPLAVVLRRGPAGAVASIGWDRATGEARLGQWLRGRIHEHRCDLSPDGRHLVLFAARGGGHAWTAVSRAPWLRAILYRPQASTWCGGGAWDEKGRLWLNGAGPAADLPDGLEAAPQDAFPHSTDGFHMGGTVTARLERRGWRRIDGEGYEARLARDLPGGGHLELGFALRARNRAIISNRYAVVGPEGGRSERPDWEWADLWAGRLQVAAQGALWELPATEPGSAPRRLHDFNALQFEAVAAPYEGVAA